MKPTLIPALLLGALMAAHATAAEDGFQSIFNGKDLSGWDGNPKLWSVKDGAIVGQTTAANAIKVNTFLIWTNGITADFELRCAFRITAHNDQGFANSGIQYRSKVLDPAQWVVGGYQADMEAGPNYTGILYDERGVAGNRGIMAARGEKVVWDQDCQKRVTGSLGKSEAIQAVIKRGDWNDYVVIAQGNHLQHFINGQPTVDVTDECASKALKSGVLALQLHVGGDMTVEFKQLRIKTLSGAATGDLERMGGVWKIAAVEANGAEAGTEDSAGLTVTIRGRNYTVAKEGERDRGKFSIRPEQNPKQMDIEPDTGPGAGRMIPAIYEFSGDKLRICYATQEGAERPTSFKTTPDSGEVLITYERKQE